MVGGLKGPLSIGECKRSRVLLYRVDVALALSMANSALSPFRLSRAMSSCGDCTEVHGKSPRRREIHHAKFIPPVTRVRV